MIHAVSAEKGLMFYHDGIVLYVLYCKFENFRENFIFANSVKRLICDVQNSRPGHGLRISVNGRAISPYLQSFIFTKLTK